MTTNQAANPESNGLSESNVKSAKLLLRKTLEEKSNFQEALAMFNQIPRADGYSLSELFFGRRIRSRLPSLDYSVDVEAGKEAREKRDDQVKEKTRTHKALPKLEVGDLVYRITTDGKTMTLIEDPCVVTRVRDHGEGYYLQDLKTDKVYLRNRRFIRRSDTAKNENFRAENLKVKYDKNLHMEVDEDGHVSKKEVPNANSIMRGRDSSPNPNNVEFDGTVYICRADLKK